MTSLPRNDGPTGQLGGAPSRRARVAELLQRERLDCIAAVGQRYATWLTGYHRYFGGLSASLVCPDGSVTLVVSPDEVPLAEAASSAQRVTAFGAAGFGLQLDPTSRLVEAIRQAAEVRAASRIGVAGVELSVLDWADGPERQVVDADLDRLSRVKDRDEVDKVCHAYELCWRAQAAVSEAAEAGASEIEMFTAAHGTAQLGHRSPVDFVADLLVGERTAYVCCPVAVAGERCPGPTDWVVADVAIGADGYGGDTCRTYVRPSTPQHVIEAIGKLETIRGDMADQLRPGAVGAELHNELRERLMHAFPGGTFPHHAGHGVGLTGFEYPHLIPGDQSIVERGTIIALEPGIYFPGHWGARVEQLFLVTDRGGVELATAVGA